MLAQYLTAELFGFLLVFCRIGAALMMMPGFGEVYVAPRIRLMLALFLSLLVAQTVSGIPPVPNDFSALFLLIATEVLIGLFIGSITRMLISGVQIAGGIISYQSSMSTALTNNTTGFSGQDTSISNLLAVTAVVLMFAMNMHHMVLHSLVESYSLFALGQMPYMEDIAKHGTTTITRSFRIGMQLAAPHLVIGLLLYLGAGIVARLMPNLQVFFIMMPGNIFLSLFILMVSISSVMLWFMDYFHEGIYYFLPHARSR